MQTETNCCGSATTGCDNAIAELPRYYPRQLITPDDLTLEQNYFRDKHRRHNRLLHGWGVVCGALVCPVPVQNPDGTTSFAPWLVKVRPGYVLGPYGDEILIDCARTVDLRTIGVSGVTGEPCVDAPDPWCTPVYTAPSADMPLYIAVKYKQCMTRPVRIQPVGCGCDDTSCEYSRWADGYDIGVLPTCPKCNACDPAITPPALGQVIQGDLPLCPDCSCGPWVCLAMVTVTPDGSGIVSQIDNYSCRRLVVSLASMWWKGTDGVAITDVTDAAHNHPVPVTVGATTPVRITVSADRLYTSGTYSFGPGVAVKVVTPASASPRRTIDLDVTATGTPGSHNLTVVSPDCSIATCPNAIRVDPPAVVAAPAAGPSGATKTKAVKRPPTKENHP